MEGIEIAAIDKILVVLYFVFVFGFGSYFGRYIKNTTDFFFSGPTEDYEIGNPDKTLVNGPPQQRMEPNYVARSPVSSRWVSVARRSLYANWVAFLFGMSPRTSVASASKSAEPPARISFVTGSPVGPHTLTGPHPLADSSPPQTDWSSEVSQPTAAPPRPSPSCPTS